MGSPGGNTACSPGPAVRRVCSHTWAAADRAAGPAPCGRPAARAWCSGNGLGLSGNLENRGSCLNLPRMLTDACHQDPSTCPISVTGAQQAYTCPANSLLLERCRLGVTCNRAYVLKHMCAQEALKEVLRPAGHTAIVELQSGPVHHTYILMALLRRQHHRPPTACRSLRMAGC